MYTIFKNILIDIMCSKSSLFTIKSLLFLYKILQSVLQFIISLHNI